MLNISLFNFLCIFYILRTVCLNEWIYCYASVIIPKWIQNLFVSSFMNIIGLAFQNRNVLLSYFSYFFAFIAMFTARFKNLNRIIFILYYLYENIFKKFCHTFYFKIDIGYKTIFEIKEILKLKFNSFKIFPF